MAPPPTRNEQLALDELLNDIYRGIETLPDHSARNNLSPEEIAERANQNSGNKYKITHHQQQVKQYELPSSSPLVRQHMQEIAASRNKQQDPTSSSYPFESSNTNNTFAQLNSSPQAGRSTLKRQQEQQTQSLASFITTDLKQQNPNLNQHESTATGTSKRRVRIVEHPEKLAKQQQQQQEENHKDHNYPAPGSPYARFDQDSRVKYVNSNQLIYHEEPETKWNEHDSVYTPVIDQDILEQYNSKNGDNNEQDNDSLDVDGQTRVEYYHTSWLDRQLGRASKRRSSKELNERQVKEKAMIEELKRSLKNGAITLKRSLKGNKTKRDNHNQSQQLYHGQYITSADDQLNSYTDRPAQRASSIFATIPRKPANTNINNNNSYYTNYTDNNNKTSFKATTQPYQYDSRYELDSAADQNNNIHKSSPIAAAAATATTTTTNNSYSSQTLPTQNTNHYNQASGKHQLIKSHYKGTQQPQFVANTQYRSQEQPSQNSNNMRYPQSSTLGHKPPARNCQPASGQQYNTIGRIPSATEVVRSALESSKAHQEDQRLRKTINSLESPSPYPSSPQTPTHQLKAASPSLSPSPISSPAPCSPITNNGQQVLRGSRIIPAARPAICNTNTNKAGAVYANPHASLMQHRAEQQARGIYGSTTTTNPSQYKSGANQASLREFNELDSLLKSLSPGGVTITSAPRNSAMASTLTPTPTLISSGPQITSATGPKAQITPGYSSRPAQATLGGYGGVFPAQQQQPLDVYAKIQKQQQNVKPLQPSHLNNTNFTLDVTDDRSTLERPAKQQQQHQQWENVNKPQAQQYEILPSMEDYQNISKLNPVRNHYWYKPNMSRELAISLLKDKPQGTFIVRDSNSFKGAYGLAVKVAKLPQNVLNNSSLRDPRANPADELIRHFLIEPTASGVRLKGYANEPVFGSLPNLIYQHSLTELALPCRLIIPRADIEDSQFNLKQKQFFEEFLASKEEAKHTPYERTSPNGGYRRYPGDVLVHNEHRIIFQ